MPLTATQHLEPLLPLFLARSLVDIAVLELLVELVVLEEVDAFDDSLVFEPVLVELDVLELLGCEVKNHTAAPTMISPPMMKGSDFFIMPFFT